MALKRNARSRGDHLNVLVSTPRQIDDNYLVRRHARRQLINIGHGVTGLERGDDPLAQGKLVKRRKRGIVIYRHVLRAPCIFQPCVLGTHTRIIKPRRNRMRRFDLAVLILHQVGSVTVQYAGAPGAQWCGVTPGFYTVTTRLNADDLDFNIIEKRVKQSDGI